MHQNNSGRWLVWRNLCIEVINHAPYLWDIYESHLDLTSCRKSKPWWPSGLTDERCRVLCPLSESYFKRHHCYVLDLTARQPQVAMALGEINGGKKRNMTVKQIWNCSDFERTSQGHTNTHKDWRRDELTDGETGGMEGGGQITEGEEFGVKKRKERNRVRERGMEGGNGKEEPCVVHLQSV